MKEKEDKMPKKEIKKTEPERLILAQSILGHCLMELLGKMSYSKKLNFSLDNLIKRAVYMGKDSKLTKKEINEMLNLKIKELYEMVLAGLAKKD